MTTEKVLTIYLDREGYRVTGKRSPAQSHGVVQEHLEEYLKQGWKVKMITGAGGAGAGAGEIGCGWVVVVLERGTSYSVSR
jgi:hypothetical protein